MKVETREQVVSSLLKRNTVLTWSLGAAMVVIVLLAMRVTFMSEIIHENVPGMPDGAKIWKNGMDEGAIKAIALAVASNLASVNPSNQESVKSFVQPFLSADAYTVVSQQIDAKAALLAAQHELGSYYFVLGPHGFQYDDKLKRIYVSGDVHTVNAAKDTGEPWVFEFPVHFAQYRMFIDAGLTAYPGNKIHNSEWIQAQTKK